jgi:indolepyruvate ferredoxin oxidoreductase, beta subunit
VMDAFQRSVSPMSPATLRELCDAALADETGGKLRDAIARHALG